jgi:hypothetical protein
MCPAPTAGSTSPANTVRAPVAQTRSDLNPIDFTDAQANAALARITRGNFRLVDRLFTGDVIEAARSTLVIGLS